MNYKEHLAKVQDAYIMVGHHMVRCRLEIGKAIEVCKEEFNYKTIQDAANHVAHDVNKILQNNYGYQWYYNCHHAVQRFDVDQIRVIMDFKLCWPYVEYLMRQDDRDEIIENIRTYKIPPPYKAPGPKKVGRPFGSKGSAVSSYRPESAGYHWGEDDKEEMNSVVLTLPEDDDSWTIAFESLFSRGVEREWLMKCIDAAWARASKRLVVA